MVSNTIPLVSVVTITYNHEPWIAKCIEGVLAQKVNFPIEHIIAEDCSTDGTRAICEQYSKQHPDIIRLLPSEHNLGVLLNEKRAMQAVRGKYIAFLEGDDYWTEPTKLQQQVDFLETHPDYSVCFTRWTNIDAVTGVEKDDKCSNLFEGSDSVGIDVPIDLFFSHWCTQPLTMVYRADAICNALYDYYKHYRDTHQIYHLLKAGKGFLFAFNSGCRIIHNGGMASMESNIQNCITGLSIAKELYYKNKDVYTKTYLEQLLQFYLYNIGKIKKRRIKYSFELFMLNHSFTKLTRNLIRK